MVIELLPSEVVMAYDDGDSEVSTVVLDGEDSEAIVASGDVVIYVAGSLSIINCRYKGLQ